MGSAAFFLLYTTGNTASISPYCSQMEPITDPLDFDTTYCRLQLLLTLVKLYQLLCLMVDALLASGVRAPSRLFEVEKRGDKTMVELHPHYVQKRLVDFQSFAVGNFTSLGIIIRAYAASATSCPGELPFLVRSIKGPVVNAKGTYAVRTYPVGSSGVPDSEEVSTAGGLMVPDIL